MKEKNTTCLPRAISSQNHFDIEFNATKMLPPEDGDFSTYFESKKHCRSAFRDNYFLEITSSLSGDQRIAKWTLKIYRFDVIS